MIELTEFIGDLEQLLGEETEIVPLSREFGFLMPGGIRHQLLRRTGLATGVRRTAAGPPPAHLLRAARYRQDVHGAAARWHLTGGKPENVQLVQFHPAYSYEDFFEGYRPGKAGRRASPSSCARPAAPAGRRGAGAPQRNHTC